MRLKILSKLPSYHVYSPSDSPWKSSVTILLTLSVFSYWKSRKSLGNILLTCTCILLLEEPENLQDPLTLAVFSYWKSLENHTVRVPGFCRPAVKAWKALWELSTAVPLCAEGWEWQRAQAAAQAGSSGTEGRRETGILAQDLQRREKLGIAQQSK